MFYLREALKNNLRKSAENPYLCPSNHVQLIMARKKEWKEGEMMLTFHLSKITASQTPLMQEWLTVESPHFDNVEQAIFDKSLQKAIKNMSGWSEEDLKMKFISHILELGNVVDGDNFVSFFDKALEEEDVEGHKLSVKADFVVAKGMLDFMQRPYFHFQEYKPKKNPTGDPMAQLLEAFLIGQTKNRKEGIEIPLYGCEIVGKHWTFVTIEGKEYCVSKDYDSTEKDQLLHIIAVLRKFREILETRLLK